MNRIFQHTRLRTNHLIKKFAQVLVMATIVVSPFVISYKSHAQEASELPALLSSQDQKYYQIALQSARTGKFAELSLVSVEIKNRLLIDSIWGYGFWLNPKKVSYKELHSWLANNKDLPIATQLFAVAKKFSPKEKAKFAALSKPQTMSILVGAGDDLPVWIDRDIEMNAHTKKVFAQIKKLIAKDNLAQAQKLFDKESLKIKNPAQLDSLSLAIANRLFMKGTIESDVTTLSRALDYSIAASRSAKVLSQAPWLAGLIEWRFENYSAALDYFTIAAESPAASKWTANRNGFWAARAAMALGNKNLSREWLEKIAESKYDFYGIIAAANLNSMPSHDWTLPSQEAQSWKQFNRFPSVNRARAWIELGETELAEIELRASFLSLPESLQPFVLAIAVQNGLSQLALRMATALERISGKRYDAGYYPTVKWTPKSGFDINPALLFSFARIESHFDPIAVSPRGAMGLMQIMPHTARGLGISSMVSNSLMSPHQLQLINQQLKANKYGKKFKAQGHMQYLNDPNISLDLAQKLISQLNYHPLIKGNLIYLAIAYNGGPSMLAKAQENLSDISDPLLFLESLNSDDTRLYVQRIISGFWLYQSRLGQTPQSLRSLATGKWPYYKQTENRQELVTPPESKTLNADTLENNDDESDSPQTDLKPYPSVGVTKINSNP